MVSLNKPVPGVTPDYGVAPAGQDWASLIDVALDQLADAANTMSARPLIEGLASPGAAGGVLDAGNWAAESTPDITGNIPLSVLDRQDGRRNPAASRIARRQLPVASKADLDAAVATVNGILGFGWWHDIVLSAGAAIDQRQITLPNKTRLKSPVKYARVIKLDNPDGSGSGVTNIESPFFIINDTEMTGVKVTTHNGRYAIHHDNDAQNVDTTQIFEDCWFEHLGNTDSFSGVWVTPPAFGSGTASGQLTILRRCVLRSKGEHPFATHSNRPFTRPSVMRLEDCVLEVAGYGYGGDGRGILLASLGSQVTPRLEIKGTSFRGLHYIEHQTAPWRATDGSTPHVEWSVTITGSDTLGWLDSGTAADGTTPLPDATFYPEQPDKEISPVATGTIPQWSAVVYDGQANSVKVAPTSVTAGQFVGIALFAATAGQRVRILRDAKLFPSQTVGITTANFEQPIYLSTTTTGGLTTTAGGPQVGVGVGIKNLVHVVGRKDI